MPRLHDYQIQATSALPPEFIPVGTKLIGAPLIWSVTTGENVKVAVMDTGIDKNHPDLKDAIVDGYNFTSVDPTDYQDRNGHGTHVAGTIGARQGNGGITGVAPGCRLVALKVLNDQGTGAYDWLIAACNWIVAYNTVHADDPIRAVNLSLAGPEPDPTDAVTVQQFEAFHQGIKNVRAAGCLVVCAAGNGGDGNAATIEKSYPASWPETLSVAAVTMINQIAVFSESNDQVDLAAPGVDIDSCWPGGGYARLQGTSMASPHVTGKAALTANRFFKANGRWPAVDELYGLMKYETVNPTRLPMDDVGAGIVSFTLGAA